MDLNYLKQLSAYEVLGKLFARKNKNSKEHVFVYFDTRMTLECLICSDGGKYDFFGNHLYNPELSIVAESKYYGRFNHLETKKDEAPYVILPEKARLKMREAVNAKLADDVESFNKDMDYAISSGTDKFWSVLPSIARVEQLASFLNSKGYKVKAFEGLTEFYIEVQL